VAWRHGRQVALAEFAGNVAAVAARLARGRAMINLCDDRYYFLVAYAAALSRGHTVLLPPSRAEQIVGEVERTNAGSYRCDDSDVEAALRAHDHARANESFDPTLAAEQGVDNLLAKSMPNIPAASTAMIGFTSGSTGQPKAFPKLWSSIATSTRLNAASIREELKVTPDSTVWVVATVPPQHMYGMELSILLPLVGGMAVHEGRPLFPADIAKALAELPEPRILVSTPVHLRAIVESAQQFPATALIVSATAPLDAALAQAVEAKFGGRLLEMFGSTETCVFAHRRTAIEASWQLYRGVELRPLPEGTSVNAPWFAAPLILQDIVELHDGGRFTVRGRNTDLIEVAGKRASLADITRRLLAIEGVRDAVVFQPDPEAIATIRRVAALVVAPGRSAREVLDRLAPGVDPAFLPRPLVIVESLPRNEVGKLPREALLRALRGSGSG
jgi:acyl-coenzyme A synthetase/AMP-(fatty) acid ligase